MARYQKCEYCFGELCLPKSADAWHHTASSHYSRHIGCNRGQEKAYLWEARKQLVEHLRGGGRIVVWTPKCSFCGQAATEDWLQPSGGSAATVQEGDKIAGPNKWDVAVVSARTGDVRAGLLLQYTTDKMFNAERAAEQLGGIDTRRGFYCEFSARDVIAQFDSGVAGGSVTFTNLALSKLCWHCAGGTPTEVAERLGYLTCDTRYANDTQRLLDSAVRGRYFLGRRWRRRPVSDYQPSSLRAGEWLRGFCLRCEKTSHKPLCLACDAELACTTVGEMDEEKRIDATVKETLLKRFHWLREAPLCVTETSACCLCGRTAPSPTNDYEHNNATTFFAWFFGRRRCCVVCLASMFKHSATSIHHAIVGRYVIE